MLLAAVCSHSVYINTVIVCMFWQCVWPHQLQIRLGAGQSRLQAVIPTSVFWVGLRVVATHGPAGNLNLKRTDHTHLCIFFLFNPDFFFLQLAGGEMHHGSGAKLQEEEGHVVLHQREKLHFSPEQPAMPVHWERLHLVSTQLQIQAHSTSNVGVGAVLIPFHILYIFMRQEYLSFTFF